MKQAKKYLAIGLSLILAFASFVGCSSKSSTGSSDKICIIGGSAYASISEDSSTLTLYGDYDVSETGTITSSTTTSTADSCYAAESPMSGDGIISGDGVIDSDVIVINLNQPSPQAGLLTAGAWDDNENYEFFTEVLNRQDWYTHMENYNIFPTSRIAVHVLDPDTQSPVKGASVKLLDSDNVIFSAVTDHNGNAWLYYDINSNGASPDKITVSVANNSTEYSIENIESQVEIQLKAPESGKKTLDLMFVVDTTGSMSDELEYLKEELNNVISRVSNANSGMNIRLSVNFYRDDGDEYIVKYFAFTNDIDKALRDLEKQYSDGGGDTPEAVHVAFDNAVNDHDWSETSVKLMFFVLDAPPHVDHQGVPESMLKSIESSAALGIRIIPIVASGADTETEFIMRTAAAMTGGTYTFLTDDSGIGFSHMEPTIGEYDVEALNELMIRLINEYCA